MFDFRRSMFMESNNVVMFGRAEYELTVMYIDVGPLSSLSALLLDFFFCASLMLALFFLVSSLACSCASVIGGRENRYPVDVWYHPVAEA